MALLDLVLATTRGHSMRMKDISHTFFLLLESQAFGDVIVRTACALRVCSREVRLCLKLHFAIIRQTWVSELLGECVC